jgi:hypothetical protein
MQENVGIIIFTFNALQKWYVIYLKLAMPNFQVIQQFFRETAGFSKSLSDMMSKTTIIPFYSYRMCFGNRGNEGLL